MIDPPTHIPGGGGVTELGLPPTLPKDIKWEHPNVSQCASAHEQRWQSTKLSNPPT